MSIILNFIPFVIAALVFVSNTIGDSRPSSEKCAGPNEQYYECGLNECNNQPCSTLGIEINCIDLCDPSKAGCGCIPNFRRNNLGICVNSSNCQPVCFAHNHEKLAPCGAQRCNNPTCADPQPADICSMICKLVGDCVCISPYVRDERTGKCVKPCECSKVTKSPSCPSDDS